MTPAIENVPLDRALAVVCAQGQRLQESLHFDWPSAIQQAAYRLRAGSAELPPIAALVGGASSGKSTIFDNLLGGRSTSRVTARGHATLGPILAAHESLRDRIGAWLKSGVLFPDRRHKYIELDENDVGGPNTLSVVFHGLDALRDLLLLDTPDFTSEISRTEGDVTLALLPWFDRLIVVLDHERWFDKQSISQLRAESARFGQQRFVVFNRTKEGELSEQEHDLLRQQAERLSGSGTQILEFRRGRGLCLFPPNTFDALHEFLRTPAPRREAALLNQVGQAAGRALNQNDERSARLKELRGALIAAVQRCVPTVQESMISVMTSSERSQLEPLARILRLDATRSWLAAQGRRLQAILERVPVVGALSAGSRIEAPTHGADRMASGLAFFEAAVSRQAHEIQRVTHGSRFWAEIERWTQLRPRHVEFQWDQARGEAVRRTLADLERAVGAWNVKVETECGGLAPHVKGAVGLGVLALAVVLIAAPGPITALTFVAAKGAIGAALSQLAAALGLGAVFGKHAGRLAEVIREQLLGSAELDTLQSAARAFRGRIESEGRRMSDEALAEAAVLVLPVSDPLAEALEHLRHAREQAS